MERKDYRKIAEVAMRAGQIMLEANAETYRVEDTVRRILQTSQLATAEVFANAVGLFITLNGSELEAPITLIARIAKRDNQLSKIYRVNNISRALTTGQIDIYRADDLLEDVEESEYTAVSKTFASFLLIPSITVVLDGGFYEVILALFSSGFVILGQKAQKRYQMNDFITTLLTSAVVAIVINFLSNFTHERVNIHIAIISALMSLFPGTAFTNGVRDTLKGDFTAGIARITEAIIIGVSLGAGAGLGLYLAKWVVV